MNDLYSMISMASNKLRTNKNIISFYKINVRLIIYKKKKTTTLLPYFVQICVTL